MAVRHGDLRELAVDARYLQFYDPRSGLSLGTEGRAAPGRVVGLDGGALQHNVCSSDARERRWARCR